VAPDDLVRIEVNSIPGRKGAVVTLTLNRPAQLNAISWEMIDSLDAAITQSIAIPDLRAMIVTGAGRAFSAGGDLKAYRQLQRDATRFPEFVAALHSTFGRFRTLAVPVIALVNGVTAAGGLELLLNCDIGIIAESARVGDGHLNFGQMGGGGVLTLLPRYVGIARATELVVSGRPLSSSEAVEWGLVTRAVPDDQLMTTGMELVGEIARKSPLAVANAKYVMVSVWADALSVTAGMRLERERNSLYCLTSEDAPEGLLAFTQKRDPDFVGR
jgi:enoyl-CoA hydratase/carnithine racemase